VTETAAFAHQRPTLALNADTCVHACISRQTRQLRTKLARAREAPVSPGGVRCTVRRDGRVQPTALRSVTSSSAATARLQSRACVRPIARAVSRWPTACSERPAARYGMELSLCRSAPYLCHPRRSQLPDVFDFLSCAPRITEMCAHVQPSTIPSTEGTKGLRRTRAHRRASSTVQP
jgi:hypothetical protein